MDSLRAEGQGTTKVPWKADFAEAGRAKSLWGVSCMIVTNKEHPAFGRLVTMIQGDHPVKRPINGKWHIRCIDTRNLWLEGEINLYPEGKSNPLHLTAVTTDLQAVLLDHDKFLWLTEEQIRIVLQGLVLDVKRKTHKWSHICVRHGVGTMTSAAFSIRGERRVPL